MRKRRKSKFVIVFLAFLREWTLLLLVFHQELHFISLLLHTSRRRFPANLWRTQLVRSCWSASVRTNISLYTCLRSNFSIPGSLFFNKTCFGTFVRNFGVWAFRILYPESSYTKISDELSGYYILKAHTPKFLTIAKCFAIFCIIFSKFCRQLQ